jgi:hypothetical protein
MTLSIMFLGMAIRHSVMDKEQVIRYLVRSTHGHEYFASVPCPVMIPPGTTNL